MRGAVEVIMTGVEGRLGGGPTCTGGGRERLLGGGTVVARGEEARRGGVARSGGGRVGVSCGDWRCRRGRRDWA